MSFRPPFRPAGFFEPADSLDSCDLEMEEAQYTRNSLSLCPGCMITIAAFILPETQTFIVDLVTDSKDLALHLSARLAERVLVLNSTHRGRWQTEARVRDLQLRPGRAFCLCLMPTRDRYLVALDNEHLTEFPHRQPLKSVTSLSISCGLRMAAVYFEVDCQYSSFSLSSQTLRPQQHSCELPPATSVSAHQLPVTLAAKDNFDGGLLADGTVFEASFRTEFSSKDVSLTFCSDAAANATEAAPSLQLELFLQHRQGRVTLRQRLGGGQEQRRPLWSIVGLIRRSHVDVCVRSCAKSVTVFVGHRPVLRVRKSEFSTWQQLTRAVIDGDAKLLAARVYRLADAD